MKRILILSDINSSHTQKWCESLAEEGYEIGIFSLSEPQTNWYISIKRIKLLHSISFSKETFHLSSFLKIKYLKALPHLKNAITHFKPDILHSHYATSYGLLGAISGFHPFLISTWGTDLMSFPYKSSLHKAIIKFNFKKADMIMATSNELAAHINKFTSKPPRIISFGVDTSKFKPVKVAGLFNEKDIVIGTVKSLEKIYGIDLLIKGFASLKKKYAHADLKLLIVGSGTLEAEYKSLVKDLNVDDLTIFTGRIDHHKLPAYYNMLNIFVNVSQIESFGVSVLEASACGLPVVVSYAGGLKEVVIDKKTGFFIDVGNKEQLFNVLEMLITDSAYRSKIGEAGVEFVKAHYEWKKSVVDLKSVYASFS